MVFKGSILYKVAIVPLNFLKLYSTLSMLGKNFSRHFLKIFSYFSQKIGFEISYNWSPKETICMVW